MFPLFFMRTVKNMTEQNECAAGQTIDITVLGPGMKSRESGLRWFLPILRKGFETRARNRASIREFFCRDMGGDPECLDRRIQTLFLNGKPVDDVDSTPIDDGAVLAFSSAMPGVAGATLRKGGTYAPMRAAISRHEDKKDSRDEYGHVTLKLFNMVAEELGGFFLEKGIFVNGSDIEYLFGGDAQNRARGMDIRLNGDPVSAARLVRAVKTDSRILLKVILDHAEPPGQTA